MKIARKEMLVGVLFAIAVAIFLNYTSIERIIIDRSEVGTQLLYPLIFSTGWSILISMLFYFYYVGVFNIFGRNRSELVIFIPIFIGAVIVCYALSEMQPHFRDLLAPEGFEVMRQGRGAGAIEGAMGGGMRPPRGAMNATLFKHLLVLILNLLFFYIQRLLYTNQAIARRNEQLQFETIKSQHNALLQQINPHFFFNSLNSLRYIIMRGEVDGAVEYLDNLTAIFRKTLKASSQTLHTLSEELAITTSYTHIIERRFEGKFSVEFCVAVHYEEYLIAPLTLLTLVENVVKHNKISSREPIRVMIFTTDGAQIVVENNIVHKFEEVEQSGIGLKNLSLQYELLMNEGVKVDSNDERFSVTIPLIERRV